MNQDTLMVSKVTLGDEISWSVPEPLFVSAEFLNLNQYAVSADGQRILLTAENPDAPAREIHVVLNWFEELKAKKGN